MTPVNNNSHAPRPRRVQVVGIDIACSVLTPRVLIFDDSLRVGDSNTSRRAELAGKVLGLLFDSDIQNLAG
jgi:hypothetical protein